jgi:hypothetical protein
MESAKMASDLHKQRTGKPLNVTKEAVSKNEKYEEAEE